MGSAVELRTDYPATELRRLARMSKDTRQSSRLLSLVAVLDGMSRGRSKDRRDGSPDLARLGALLQRGRTGWACGFLVARPHTTAFTEAVGRVGRNC